MWVFLNDGFLSIVQPKKQTPGQDILCVRARKEGHIQAVFGDVEVIKTPKADYLYRAFIPRAVVAQIIAQRLRNLAYSNFKDSIPDDEYHDACAEVWGVMNSFQVEVA
jgi:hypothetical protein